MYWECHFPSLQWLEGCRNFLEKASSFAGDKGMKCITGIKHYLYVWLWKAKPANFLTCEILFLKEFFTLGSRYNSTKNTHALLELQIRPDFWTLKCYKGFFVCNKSVSTNKSCSVGQFFLDLHVWSKNRCWWQLIAVTLWSHQDECWRKECLTQENEKNAP